MPGYRLMTGLALCWLAPVWGANWAVLEGGRFTLYTDAGEAEARRVFSGLGEMEAGMDAVWRPLPAGAPPVRVYLFGDMAGLRRMGAQGFSKGFFQSGPDYDSIAVVAGDTETVRAVRHEYVHRVLHRTSRRVPQWLEEGIAELYSTLSWDGARWLVGQPVVGHIDYLRGARWAEFATLERMHEDGSLWSRADKVMLYYGQCWALTHFLAVASPGAAERFEALVARLTNGEPAAAALKAEYGMNPGDLLREARARVEQGRMTVRRMAPPKGARPPPPAMARWRPVTDDEAAMALAELTLATGNRAGDGEWLARLRQAAGGSPRALTGLGVLALRRGAKEEAEAHFRKAVDAGVDEPAAWFELAMLVRDREGSTPEVRQLLERTVALNPGHAEGLYLLAMEEQRMGRPAQAAALLERAAKALPRQFAFREALARVYAGAGRMADAREQAVAARAAAGTADERAMAEGLWEELERAGRPRTADARKPEVTVPRAWLEPHNDGEVRGTLVRVVCANPVVFEIDTGERVRQFKANPARLMVSGRPQDRPFQCGEQKERARVAARFRSPDLLVQLVFLEAGR